MKAKISIMLLLLYTFAANADISGAFDNIEKPSFFADSKFLADNNEAFYERWKAIEEAQSSIILDVFYFGNDVFNKGMMGALLKKAEAGVKIYIIADVRAQLSKSALERDYFQEMVRNDNIDIVYYNSLIKQSKLAAIELLKGHVKDINIRSFSASNHDKIMIVDNKIVITGGRNLGIEYFASPIDLPQTWRDSDIVMRLENTANASNYITPVSVEWTRESNVSLKKDFLINFNSKSNELMASYKAVSAWINGKPIGSSLNKFPKLKEEIQKHKNLRNFNVYNFSNFERTEIKTLDKVSFVGSTENEITNSLISLIDATEYELIIQNPYVVLTDAMWQAISRAHDRNVDIIIHTNSLISTDSLFTQAFFIEDWDKIRKDLPNVKIFAFTGIRKMHSKVFVFDRAVSAIGTYNMDSMSEQINSEIVTLVKSTTFTNTVMEQIKIDIDDSLDMTNADETSNFSPLDLGDPSVKKKIARLRKYKFLRPLI